MLLMPLGLMSQRRSAVNAGNLPEGSNIVVRLTERLDSDSNQTGDPFSAVLDQDLVVDGRVFAREGDPVTGRLVEVRDAGEVSGRARMVLTLSDIDVDGRMVPLETNSIVVEADNSKKKDAAVIGGGAALGAIIGAIAGGGKGAVIGAAVGAAAGTGGVLITEGRDVEFETEQRFNFILERSTSASGGDVRGPYSRRDQRTGDWPRSGGVDRSGTLGDIARTLDERAQQLWSSLRDREDWSSTTNAGDESRLEQAVRGFAEDARRFADDSRSASSNVNPRATARRLINRSQRISRLMDRATVSANLRDDWRVVEDQLVRLSDYFQLGYDPSRTLARTDPYDTAVGSGVFRWRGRVDGSDYIYLSGNRVTTRHLAAGRIEDSSYDLGSALPRRSVDLRLNRIQGRGRVELVQQPSASNNYTAAVLIEDSAAGADFYEFELSW
jgi:hypothetical protein